MAGWLDHVVRARALSLEDLTVAQMSGVALLVGDGRSEAAERLVDDALSHGFAVARCSLASEALSDLDAVVRALATSLRMPKVEAGRRHGLVTALDAFVERHGKKSEERFEERAEEEALSGELRRLASDYLAHASGKASARRLTAWLGGQDVSAIEGPVRPLSPRTAKRALAQLTRLTRALGARGTRILFTDAEALVDLSPGRRDVAYTVLRELVDNADGSGQQGAIACELLLVGGAGLVERKAALSIHEALASRLLLDAPPSWPVPHATLVPLEAPDNAGEPPPLPPRGTVEARHAALLRTLLRLGQGLPPVDAGPELTIGMDAIDERLDKLFEHAQHDGSVFAVLSGEYGAGKTHQLLHLESRALADQRPVFRLSVERLDEDLGNPQRHLRRLLESAVLPLRRKASAFDRAEAWVASPSARRRLSGVLAAIAAEGGEAARAVERIAASSRRDEEGVDPDAVLEVLGALDLVDKPAAASYRKDAYARLHLWLELLRRIEGCEGPVIILDEAENLYRAGVSRPERRTALRSLAFYCGGAIARACVVFAVTPDTFEALREEAGALLDEIEEQATLLPSEDVALLRRRLLRSRPLIVTRLARDDLRTLSVRVRQLHRGVRGATKDPGWEDFLDVVIASARTPREVLRRVVLRLEELSLRG
jgi:hypothetical protein